MLSVIMISLYKNKIFWFLEHMLFAGIPVYFAVMKFATRPFGHYALMLIVVAYIWLISLAFKTKKEELGLSLNHSSKHILKLLPGTIIISALILIGKMYGIIYSPSTNINPLVYIFISVPLQELVFRSFCVWRCSLSWSNRLFIALFTSVNFAFYHIIFGNWQLALGVFFINLYWSYYYFKQNDITAIVASHALIGLAYFL